MTLHTTGYTATIVFLTLLALFSAASIVVFTTPHSLPWYTFALFYLSIFLSATGLALLAGVAFRYKLLQERFLPALLTSLRQGILIAVLIVSSLILQAERLLYWWVELSIILLLVVIEVLFNL